MHPRIEELLDHLDRRRLEVRGALEAIPFDRHQVQPDGAWSVVNVLEHLAMVEGGVASLFRKRIDAARTTGLGQETETSSVLEQPIFGTILDRRRRIQGSDAVRPVSGIAPDNAWRNLEQTRSQLREVVMSADGLALGELTHPHRVFGPLNFYQWLVFVADHEARHAAQIREIGDRIGGIEPG
jgi:DinB superfamily